MQCGVCNSDTTYVYPLINFGLPYPGALLYSGWNGIFDKAESIILRTANKQTQYTTRNIFLRIMKNKQTKRSRSLKKLN